MAQLNIPGVQNFNPHGDANSVAQRWQRWKTSFDYFIVASGINDAPRKKALLLHLLGPECQDIFQTLTITQEENQNEFDAAINALNGHFSVQKNVPFERSVFHRAVQDAEENIDQYITRLRKLSLYCEYGDSVEDQIRDQVISSCSSSKLRKRLLTEPNLTLEKVTQISQAMESAAHHSKQIEESQTLKPEREDLNKVKHYSRKYVPRKPQQSYNSRQQHSHKQQQYQRDHKQSPSVIICSRCGAKGHTGPECRRSKGKTCTKCHKQGHFASMCRTQSTSKKPQQNPQKSHASNQISNQPQDDSSTDDENDIYVFNLSSKSKHPTQSIMINNNKVNALIDSGSTLNIINETKFNLLQPTPDLKPSKVTIYPYQASKPLTLKGEFSAAVRANNTQVITTFHVVKGHGDTILGRKTSENLNILRVGPLLHPLNQVQHATETTKFGNSDIPSSTKEILDKHSALFKGTGLLKDYQLKIHLDENIAPVQQPIRRVPFHTKQAISDELERLMKLNIIEKVNGPTTWLNPVVPVPKPNGTTRLCLDMRRANEAIIRERHVIPKLEDILTELNEATVFSKIDLREGYHQILLHPDSRHITAFATHKGIFQFKRLIYGINLGFEAFQRQMEQVIAGCKGAKNISDDIAIWGKNQEEHDRNLANVLAKCEEKGLKLNPKKCIFSVNKILFAGHELSAEGINPDKKKVQSIQNIPAPKNLSELKSFLGIINYVNRYIPNYSSVAEPLRRLTKKGVEFKWDIDQQQSFESLKELLTNAETMAYYNPKAETKIIVDASPTGLGAILTQKQQNGDWRPVSYGSRALTDVESRYSQTEREALAVLWACLHYHYYIFNREFTICTDHKPLLKLLSNKSSPPPRIERWILRLQAYQYNLVYIKGKTNAADYLSRHPTNCNIEDNSSEHYLKYITTNATPKACNLEDIKLATQQDEELQAVKSAIVNSKWDKTNNHLKPYYPIRHQLSIYEGIILKNQCIVIPKCQQQSVLNIAHKNHQGLIKTKSILREKVWWPSINIDIADLIKHCQACQVVTPPSHKSEPVKMTTIPHEAFHTLAIDIKGPLPSNQYLLVLIDYRSRYPFVFILKQLTTAAIIKCIDQLFSMFGYPQKLISDNGPQFISKEFKRYLYSHRILHRRVTPYWPCANGEVERFNRTLSKFIKCAMIENRDWKKDLNSFLLDYRTTPHTVTNESPAEVLFSYKPSNDIPALAKSNFKQTELDKRDKKHKDQLKTYIDNKRNTKEVEIVEGQSVLSKNVKKQSNIEPFWEKQPYKVIKVYPSSVKVQNQKGKTYIRSKSHIKQYHHKPNKPLPNLRKTSPSEQVEHTNLSNYTTQFYLIPDEPVEQIDNNQDNIESETESESDTTIPYIESDSSWEEIENENIRPKRTIRKPLRYRENDI